MCFSASRRQLAVATTFVSNSSLMSLVGDSELRNVVSAVQILYAALTAQEVGLQDASVADEHMNGLEFFTNPVKSTGQLLFIIEVTLPGKNLSNAGHLIPECLFEVS